MKTIHPTTPAPEAVLRHRETVVGIHFALPPTSLLELETCFNNRAAFVFLMRAMDAYLRAAGVLSGSESFGVEGTFAEGLVLLRTPQRNESIKLVREFLSHLYLRPSSGDAENLGFIQIAYRTADEVWFPVEPAAPHFPFEHWMEGQPKADREWLGKHAEEATRQFILAASRHLQP